MRSLKIHISTVLGIIIMIASVLPTLHTLYHGHSTYSDTSSVDLEITKPVADCNVCDFHLENSTTPVLFRYDIPDTQKEIAYTISLTATVNLFPDPLFSLRAPPAC